MTPLRPLSLLSAALATLLAPLALIAALGNAPAQAAPARDWTRTVTPTPAGAFLIGNPAAKTRLIEFVSYTCPHCGHFAAEATAPLNAGWVSRGLVSVEIRNLVRDRYDIAAAMLARCGGPARFPGNHDALFANQQAWFEKAEAYDAAPQTLPADASRAAQLTDIAEKTGLVALMQKRGITPAQSHACLASEKALDVILAMANTATRDEHIQGTPSFIINGKLVEAHSWDELKALLPPAPAARPPHSAAARARTTTR